MPHALARLGAALLLAAMVGCGTIPERSDIPGSSSTSPRAAGSPTSPTGSPSSSSRGSSTPTPSATKAKRSGPPEGAVLKFSDEFNGTSLDLDKWRPNWLGRSDSTITKPVNRRELSCYDPRQVSVSRGALNLTAEKRPCRADNGKKYQYASGLVESNHDFRFTYGYVEARMFLPANTDRSIGAPNSCGPNWAAFWLNGKKWPDDGEIDIMECLNTGSVQWTYHWAGGKAGGRPEAWKGTMPGGGGWHVFAVDWRPGSLTFYYDGEKVGSHTKAVTTKPHYLIAALALSGTEVKVPQTLKIDYIRVWQK